MRLKIAKERQEYIYDPDHSMHPEGGYKKTPHGWTLADHVPKVKQHEKEVDFTKEEDYTESGHPIFEKQLNDEDVITFFDGNERKTKKIGEMSSEEKAIVSKQIAVCKNVHTKGFSDYSKVDLNTLEANKKKTLDFLDNPHVKLNINTRTTPVSQRINWFIKEENENLERVIDKYGDGIYSHASSKALEDYKRTLMNVIKEACSENGGMTDVSEKDMDAYLQEDMKRLIFQEVESRRRSLGDHGIRHLVGNAINTVNMLNELKNGGVQGIDGKQKFMAMSVMVSHDIGYTLGQVALDTVYGNFHKSYSGIIADQESSRYVNMFGASDAKKIVGDIERYEGEGSLKGKPVLYENHETEEYERDDKGQVLKDKFGNYKKIKKWLPIDQKEAESDKMTEQRYQNCKIFHKKHGEGWMQYHDSSDFDWKNDPVHSSIALADCTSLFGKDKEQELFYDNQEAMKEVAKMQQIIFANNGEFTDEEKDNLLSGFKQRMNRFIDKLPRASILDKDLMKGQVKEMSIKKFNTMEDILTRACGVLDGYHYDSSKNQMDVEASYSEDGKLLDDMFGDEFARHQFTKLYKDIKDVGKITLDNNGTQHLLLGNADEHSDSKVLIKIKDMGVSRILGSGVATVYKNVPSTIVKQTLARINLSKNDDLLNGLESQLNETNGKKTKGETIFAGNWEKVKQIIADLKQGKDISEELKKIGLSSQEKAYLMGGFKTASINKLAIKIALEYRIKELAMRIANDEIKRFEYEIWKTYFEFESPGTMKIIAFNHCYETPWERDAIGLKKFGDYVRENLGHYNDIDTQEQLEEFLHQDKYKWKKKY